MILDFGLGYPHYYFWLLGGWAGGFRRCFLKDAKLRQKRMGGTDMEGF
jgi:hypothetical protein